MQRAFDILPGLFNHVGMKTDTSKTETMRFLLGKVRTFLAADAYEDHMDDLYRALGQGRKVNCNLCSSRLAVGPLRSHLETQHYVFRSFTLKSVDRPPPTPCPRGD